MSAAVINMPGALSIPVANRRHPGRPPKNVISIWKLREMRSMREWQDILAEQDQAVKHAATLHKFYSFHRSRVDAITDIAVAKLMQAGFTSEQAVSTFLVRNAG